MDPDQHLAVLRRGRVGPSTCPSRKTSGPPVSWMTTAFIRLSFRRGRTTAQATRQPSPPRILPRSIDGVKGAIGHLTPSKRARGAWPAPARKAIEEIGEPLGVLDHLEVAAGDLDWLDAKELTRHEALPLGLEELVLGRVDQCSRHVGMAVQRELVRWRRGGAKPVRQLLRDARGEAADTSPRSPPRAPTRSPRRGGGAGTETPAGRARGRPAASGNGLSRGHR